jgi:hypothetical protein
MISPQFIPLMANLWDFTNQEFEALLPFWMEWEINWVGSRFDGFSVIHTHLLEASWFRP